MDTFGNMPMETKNQNQPKARLTSVQKGTDCLHPILKLLL